MHRRVQHVRRWEVTGSKARHRIDEKVALCVFVCGGVLGVKRTSGRFGPVAANTIFGEHVRRLFHQIPRHCQRQDHPGEGVDVTAYCVIGLRNLSSCSMKLFMLAVVSGLGHWMWERYSVGCLAKELSFVTFMCVRVGKVNVSPRRVQV